MMKKKKGTMKLHHNMLWGKWRVLSIEPAIMQREIEQNMMILLKEKNLGMSNLAISRQ